MVQATDTFEQPVEEPPLLGRFRDAGLGQQFISGTLASRLSRRASSAASPPTSAGNEDRLGDNHEADAQEDVRNERPKRLPRHSPSARARAVLGATPQKHQRTRMTSNG